MKTYSPINAAENLRALLKRAGYKSAQAFAKAAGYKGQSSVQRYLDDKQYSGQMLLPFNFAYKAAKALEGRGNPPIHRADVLALAGIIMDGNEVAGFELGAAGAALHQLPGLLKNISNNKGPTAKLKPSGIEITIPADSDVFQHLKAQTGPGVMLRGAVQAGLFIEAREWPEDDWRPAPVAADPRYPADLQYALEVRGPSMNLLYPAGSVVICFPLLHLDRDLKSGDKVIVSRQHNGSASREITIKELRINEAGEAWLWPRSSDPEYQQPWRISGQNGDTIEVVAIVIGSYRPE